MGKLLEQDSNNKSAIELLKQVNLEKKELINKKIIKKSGISGIGSTETGGYKPSISVFEAKLNTTEFNHGGIIAQEMGEGQELHSFVTKRPTANY